MEMDQQTLFEEPKPLPGTREEALARAARQRAELRASDRAAWAEVKTAGKQGAEAMEALGKAAGDTLQTLALFPFALFGMVVLLGLFGAYCG